MQSRGLHTCSHHNRFFKVELQNLASRANTCAKCRFWKPEFRFWVGFCSAFWKYYKTAARSSKVSFRAHFVQFHWDFIAMFRIVDTFFTISLQTFEGRNSEVHFARQKQCFGEHPCARLQPQQFFSRFPYKTAAKTTKMNPKKNNTKEPEGTRGALHHP